jgi:hypothetical protein
LTENAQREQLIKILEEYVAQLKREMVEDAAQDFAPTIFYYVYELVYGL